MRILTDKEIRDTNFDECVCGILDARDICKAQHELDVKEFVAYLKSHCKGKHRGYGHYGIYDDEIESLKQLVEDR